MLNALRLRCTKPPAYGSWPQDNVAADEIEKNAQNEKRDQGKQICIRAVEEWIVRHLPTLNSVADSGKRSHQLLRRNHNSREIAPPAM